MFSLIENILSGTSKPRNEKFWFYKNIEYNRWKEDSKSGKKQTSLYPIQQNIKKINISSSSDSSSQNDDTESLNSESQGGQSLLDTLNANGNFKHRNINLDEDEEFKDTTGGESEVTKSKFFGGVSEIGMNAEDYYTKNDYTRQNRSKKYEGWKSGDTKKGKPMDIQPTQDNILQENKGVSKKKSYQQAYFNKKTFSQQVNKLKGIHNISEASNSSDEYDKQEFNEISKRLAED